MTKVLGTYDMRAIGGKALAIFISRTDGRTIAIADDDHTLNADRRLAK